ncbi:MAG: hypothetical protein V4683_13145 [Bacteroidota bacterium]
MKSIQIEFLHLLKDTWQTAWKVLKIIIPVSIIVKIFDLLGFIDVLGKWLSPAMEMIGLPSSFGLICATTASANIYSGIYVFLNYSDNQVFTQAQVTVLGTMMLIAHSLPLELEVANRVGVKRWFMLSIRIFALFLAGFILNNILKAGDWLQTKNIPVYPKPIKTTEFIWYKWVFEQVQNYAIIVLIIFTILLIMKLLKKFGLIESIQNSLMPVLKMLGMSKEILPMTLVGMILGLVFGSALIIKEKDENPSIHKKDFVYAMVLLGLCHAIIEDTLLLVGIGASVWGILVFRVIFSLIFTYIFVKISNTNFFKQYLHLITNK